MKTYNPTIISNQIIDNLRENFGEEPIISKDRIKEIVHQYFDDIKNQKKYYRTYEYFQCTLVAITEELYLKLGNKVHTSYDNLMKERKWVYIGKREDPYSTLMWDKYKIKYGDTKCICKTQLINVYDLYNKDFNKVFPIGCICRDNFNIDKLLRCDSCGIFAPRKKSIYCDGCSKSIVKTPKKSPIKNYIDESINDEDLNSFMNKFTLTKSLERKIQTAKYLKEKEQTYINLIKNTHITLHEQIIGALHVLQYEHIINRCVENTKLCNQFNKNNKGKYHQELLVY